MRVPLFFAVLLIAGCTSPAADHPSEVDHQSEDGTLASEESDAPMPLNATLAPLNATLSGHFEFVASVESPVLDGCNGHNVGSALVSGNRLTLSVPTGYGNGTATAAISSPAPAGSYRLCLNEEDGTNVATVTGGAPLSMEFKPRSGKLYLFLWADNTAPGSPSVTGDFVLALEVRA